MGTVTCKGEMTSPRVARGPSAVRCAIAVVIAVLLVLGISAEAAAAEHPPDPVSESGTEYVLGPQDQVKIWALGMEEISDKPVRIDPAGYIHLPVLGRIEAAG